MTPASVVDEVLSGKRIVWLSARSHDSEPVVALGRPTFVISLVGSVEASGSLLGGIAFERLLGRRMDYNRFSFDDLEPEMTSLLTRTIERQSETADVILWPFFSYDVSRDAAVTNPGVRLANNPPEVQRLFEHKPWVETQLHALGVPTIPWQHVTRDQLARVTIEGACVVRPTSGTGGSGMLVVESRRDVEVATAGWPPKSLVSVAPFLDNSRSVNITAAVRADGTIALHPLSIQIIGPPSCTTARFGYCGNDFGAARQLNAPVVRAIEESTLAIGRWMASFGFLGAFGVDFLIDDAERVLLVEVNPRLQGSSHLGSILMRDAGELDVYADHLAAHLGITVDSSPMPLLDILDVQTPLAQVFAYVDATSMVAMSPSVDDIALAHSGSLTIEMLPDDGMALDHHALLFRLVGRRTVIADDRRLQDEVDALVCSLRLAILEESPVASRR